MNGYPKIALVLMIILGLVSTERDAMAEWKSIRSPVFGATAIVGQSSKNEFIETLKRFAEKNEFAIRIAPISVEGDFSVEMWRSDVNFSISNPADQREFGIALYRTCNDTPFHDGMIDSLVRELRAEISKIEGVIVTIDR
jgi:hypothetical protein